MYCVTRKLNPMYAMQINFSLQRVKLISVFKELTDLIFVIVQAVINYSNYLSRNKT